MDHTSFCRGVVFRGVPGINSVTIGFVHALCLRCAKTPPNRWLEAPWGGGGSAS